MVVNFNMPKSIDDYVHRICRAGCAGNMGNVTSFFTPKDGKITEDLENLLVEARQMMVIAFITFNSSLVPLFEGLTIGILQGMGIYILTSNRVVCTYLTS